MLAAACVAVIATGGDVTVSIIAYDILTHAAATFDPERVRAFAGLPG